MERWGDGQRTKIMVIRIAFVLGPDRLDEAALRGGSGAVELRRGNAKLSNGASPPPRLSIECYSLQERTAQGVVEAAFLWLTYKGR